MFEKILIANRGEIACRIIRTARKMGVKTVAVYSEADKDALHVETADEAIAIGPAAAAQSYLRIENIIAACKQSGAEAVHPGYGFLSERAEFARRLAQAGLVFIGPNVKAIESMGDKIASKKFAAAAGVPTVPGFLGAIESPERAAEIADEIGYPVMIKASAGGGGKGMRVAHSRAEVAQGFARARSEALASFGDDRVFVEKFIVNPRHIEIQILGDQHGNIIHLGERECSIQRRNQKIVEEAPSPLLDAASRAKMGEAAVALARGVNYDSAGTVEFVAGQDRSFYFLEMNTRLQVEHPVTEMITGVDIVEAMLRSAAGQKLRLTQADVKINGWAIESRIYAEDPARGFLPSIGRLAKYRPPAPSASLRNDTGVEEGDSISIHYDPMIAKLTTHAPDRAGAIEAQAQALDEFIIDGVRHNIALLGAIMQNSRWRAGHLSTGFLQEEFPGGFGAQAPSEAISNNLVAVAAHIDHVENLRKRQISGQLRAPGAIRFQLDRVVLLGKLRHAIALEDKPDGLSLRFNNGRVARIVSSWRPGEPVWRGAIDGQAVSVQVRAILNGAHLTHRGVELEARVYTKREASLAALMLERPAAARANALTCPMPGVVKAILVREGASVKAGEALCMIEAMKMENMLLAEHDATIGRILAAVGDSLAVDAAIMTYV